MKAIHASVLLSIIALVEPMSAQHPDMRPDIEAEVSLAKAIKDFNQKYPDNNPLTEDEVIAAVRQIKTEHPNIREPVLKLYQAVTERKVLPRGMYFSRIPRLLSGDYSFEVDWKDLTLTPLPEGSRDPSIGFGFNYRIRARFISSRALTPEEKERMKERMKKLPTKENNFEQDVQRTGSQPRRAE